MRDSGQFRLGLEDRGMRERSRVASTDGLSKYLPTISGPLGDSVTPARWPTLRLRFQVGQRLFSSRPHRLQHGHEEVQPNNAPPQ